MKKPPEPSFFQRWQNLIICLAVALATFAVYSEVSDFQFVNFDDSVYSLNPHNRQGLSPENLAWAFTSTEDANWLPITRLSHIVDTELYGKRSGPVHVENAWLHLFVSLMVFWFLFRATGARWPSAFCGMVFAVHPLHVESVAWASERKDVLCALFWFLTLWAWVAYTASPSRVRYLRTLLFFCLGLMSKPMMVSLPVILFLLDFWPLRRPLSRRTVVEKTPFVALSLAAGIATFMIQQAGGAVQSVDKIGLLPRLENSLVTWVIYLLKTIWPTNLGVFYPLRDWTIAEATLSAFALAAISAAAVWKRAQYPWIVTGWFWYLVSTLPVIGLVQVGLQSHADRYMYIPVVGLAISAAWGAAELLRARPKARPWMAAAAAVCIAAFSVEAREQAGYWRNSETLFAHTIQVTERNVVAYRDLGGALARLPGRAPDAVAAFRTATKIRPDLAENHADLSGALADAGELAEAQREAETALRLNPSLWRTHLNFGNILQRQGKTEQAIQELLVAAKARPSAAETHASLGAAFLAAGRMRECLAEEDEALRLDPGLSTAHYNKGVASLALGEQNTGIAELQASIVIDPNYAPAHDALGRIMLEIPGQLSRSIAELRTAARLDPRVAGTRLSLAKALAESGSLGEAITEMKAAVALNPDPQLVTILRQLEAMAPGNMKF